MRLDEVVRGIAITDRRGHFETDVTGIAIDSRHVSNGSMFVALRGQRQDGHSFIPQALARGATTVMSETWPDEINLSGRKPSVVLVPNSRRALAIAAANYYGQPSRKLLVAGITGTNGKTTVTYLVESIIRAASKKVGVIGTVGYRFPGHSERLPYTTPDPVVLQEKLSEMVQAGVTHVVMEVSSHALDQERVTGVHFKVAGFTNITQDHLDYHQDFERYFEAKARLFSEVLRRSRARGRMAVVNVDDPRGPEILERWYGKSLAVSTKPGSDADIAVLSAQFTLDGTEATVRTSKGIMELRSHLIGVHNLENTLIAVGMALSMGLSKTRIVRGVEALERVPGRLERIPGGEKKVFVDYAHTPDALKKVLDSLRPLTKGRLVVVFGCGGDRDQSKRAPMGAMVAAGADLAIVTNDNPRSENPMDIARAIEKGLNEGGFSALVGSPTSRQYLVELDRRVAIRTAFQWMSPDDTLVVAGKGHEDYQIIGSRKLQFDDREEVRRLLLGLPNPPPLSFDDGTHELDPSEVVSEVFEAEEVVEGDEILSETSVGPVTESVDASDVVAADVDPTSKKPDPTSPNSGGGA